MSHDNMHAWSTRLRTKLPQADTVAVLADQPGYLVVIERTPDADFMNTVEDALKQLGASGWNWTVEGKTVKIRVYIAAERTWHKIAIVALTLAALAVHYDILSFATTARCWINSRWGQSIF